MNETIFITQKKKELFGPLIFLGTIVLISIGFFLFNMKLDNSNSDLDSKIIERENDIKILESDPKIQVYGLIEANKTTIEKLEKRSMVTTYINHVKAISNKFDIVFDGFTLVNGKITLNAIINSSEKGIAYAKTRDFIKNYRNDEKALFDLDFINSIEGMDSIKFNVIFNIK